jgi:hypothetical protein
MTIKLINANMNFVVPQAILWRPMEYFTGAYREESDDLDSYKVASFQLGNRAVFDLRNYAGHPPFTTSLYLAFEMHDEGEIVECVETIIFELHLPETAVAWKRGLPFEYGVLERHPADRLREAEARILALKIAAESPQRTASMSIIKKQVERYFEPSPHDMRPSPTRGEPMWKQIIGNVISHSGSRRGPFVRGLAKRTPNGLTVTDAGLRYLKSIGFLSSE